MTTGDCYRWKRVFRDFCDDERMGEDARSWIRVDETAKRMLSRVLKDRAFLLLPPLHRVPLRAGNVVEITGASPSAKTQILNQAAINCILPQTWNDIHYGGLGKVVLYLDLDCRFDVLRLSQMLKHRLIEANRLGNGAWWKIEESNVRNCRYDAQDKSNTVYDEELYVSCMKRFLCVRCYDSLELLSTLKILHYRIGQVEACGNQVGVLMIDSIGAFHWTDRLSSSLAMETQNRKSLSLTNVVETIVQEMKKILQVHSLVVIATKSTIYEEKYQTNENNRKFSSNEDLSENAANKPQQPPLREFMPSSWQAFVTHKITTRKSADLSTYSLEWLQPQLSSIDRFIVNDSGIVIVS